MAKINQPEDQVRYNKIIKHYLEDNAAAVRINLDVPGLDTNNTFNGTQTVNGDLVVNGKLTVTGPIDPTYIEFTQITTPSNPAATKNRLYFKGDDNVYMLNSSGVETQINGGGSGSPAGSNTQVQFNNAGAFGASASFTWNGSVLAATGFSGVGSSLTALNATNISSGTLANAHLTAQVPLIGQSNNWGAFSQLFNEISSNLSLLYIHGRDGNAPTVAGGDFLIRSGSGNAGADGGSLTMQGGNTGVGAAGNGGATYVLGGFGQSTNGNGGLLSLEGGQKTGTGTAGAITIGTAVAESVTIGRATKTTTINGTLVLATDLAIADGGTGAGTATAAFDNLAPTTTNGDLIYYNGTDNVRLAIGTAAQVLTVTGGVPTWAAAGGTPAGNNTEVQYNNSSAFGASASLTWNNGTSTLTTVNTVLSTITAQTTTLTIDGLDATAGNTNGGAITATSGNGFGTGDGGTVTISSGASGTGATGDGGNIFIDASGASSINGNGGYIQINGGPGSGTGVGGVLFLYSGDSGTGATGNGGEIELISGYALSMNGVGGQLHIESGLGAGTGAGGNINIFGGNGGATGAGGPIAIFGGSGGATSGNGGAVNIDGGTVVSGTRGAITIGTTFAESVSIGRLTKTTTVKGPMVLGVASSGAGSVAFKNATNANTLTINAGVFGAAISWTLPTAQGAASTFLQNDGTGVLSWVAGGGGITGSGTANYLTYWTGASAVSANAAFQIDATNFRLGIGGVPTHALEIIANTSGTGTQGIAQNITHNSVLALGSLTGVFSLVSVVTGADTVPVSGGTIQSSVSAAITVTTAYGASLAASISGSASVSTEQIGGLLSASFASSGTCAFMAGGYSNATISAGTVTAAYGHYIYINKSAGTVTSMYGLYVDDVNTGTTNYAIYTESGRVRFGGEVQCAFGLALAYVAKTANYTATADEYTITVDASGAARTITIPNATTLIVGKVFVIKKIDSSANNVTIAIATGTVDGAASIVFNTQYQSYTIQSDGTNWHVI